MDRKTLGLGIALGYREQAFKGVPAAVVEEGAELVRRAGGGEPVAAEVVEFLRSQPKLNEWVEQLLEDRSLRPPHLQPRKVRSFEKLPGEPGLVSAPRYTCQNCGYTWYQAFASDTVPDCFFCREKLGRA
jgi:lipopolysaccharide biosynthesis regulator YciM